MSLLSPTGFQAIFGAKTANILLVLATVLAFSPALFGDFLWDDNAVIDNPVVARPSGLFDIWFNPMANIREEHYWPVTYTAFWAQYQLWGKHPAGYHAFNVLLHAINGLLIWKFLTRRAVPGALWVALLFAIHPTKVESVAWVVELKDVLSGFFYILSFSALVDYVEKASKSAGTRSFILGLLFFVLALLSKSVAVTLPAALGIYLWWRQKPLLTKPVLLVFACLGVIAASVTAYDLWLVARHTVTPFPVSPNLKMLIVGRAFWIYLMRVVAPWKVAAIDTYDVTDLHPELVVQYLYPIAAAGLILLLWLLRRELGRGPLAGILYFFVTLSPTLGFVSFSYMKHALVADRFLYLAMIGPALLTGCVMHRMVSRSEKQFVRVLCTLLVAMLGVYTFTYTLEYQTTASLFRGVVRRNPEALVAHAGLGNAAVQSGRLQEAEQHYREAIRLQPEYTEARISLAWILMNTGNPKEALRQAKIALRLNPASSTASQLLRQIESPTP